MFFSDEVVSFLVFVHDLGFLYACVFQAETEMEYVEAAALKTSFRKEMTVKSTPQWVSEDLSPGYAQNGVGCDDFFVDELLDLSNEDGFVKEEPTEEEEEDKGFISVSHQQDHQNSNTNITFSAKDEFGSELSVPVLPFLLTFVS